jgi:hypothetical protein
MNICYNQIPGLHKLLVHVCRSQWPRTKAWVCGRSLPGIENSNKMYRLKKKIPPRAEMSLSLASVACCQVEASASGRSLVQRSPTGCVVCVCDREASIWGSPGPLGAVASFGGGGPGNSYTFRRPLPPSPVQ